MFLLDLKRVTQIFHVGPIPKRATHINKFIRKLNLKILQRDFNFFGKIHEIILFFTRNKCQIGGRHQMGVAFWHMGSIPKEVKITLHVIKIIHNNQNSLKDNLVISIRFFFIAIECKKGRTSKMQPLWISKDPCITEENK